MSEWFNWLGEGFETPEEQLKISKYSADTGPNWVNDYILQEEMMETAIKRIERKLLVEEVIEKNKVRFTK